FITNISFASYENVTMSVLTEPVCTINLTEKSIFEKKLISKNLQNKEVTMQLKVTNNEIKNIPTGELILVLDNSDSMKEQIKGTTTTRSELIRSSAKKLISDLLKDNTKLKIGIVSFSTNTTPSKEGTIEDSQLVSDLSTDPNVLNSAIDTIQDNGPRTNLEAGLTLGNQKFSAEKNEKYMIVLTDGVPNVAINYDKTYYSDDVINKTKAKLQSISNSGIHLITTLTGIEDESFIPVTTTKSFGEIIKETFGTPQAPIAGTFYYIKDTDIEKIITQTIYNSLIPISKTLTNIVVKDYFPKEIIDNFNFAYIKEANIGNISTNIDTTTNAITWTIPDLKPGETAIVQYTLKLKKDYNSSIVEKILKTNEKIDINYNDLDNKPQTKTSDVSPTLKLSEPAKVLPKAGTTFISTTLILVSGFAIFSLIKYLITNINKKH
ncbi:MAG: vWA domain-containing protein, partial [Clostridia bacterium]